MASLWSTDHFELINLGKGHPNPSFLPLDAYQKAFDEASKRPASSIEMMQYGRMQGNEGLCKHISAWIAKATGRPCSAPSPDNLLITCGSGPGMNVVFELFTNPGETVFVDSPGYFICYPTFRECGLNIVEVPTDGKGLNVDEMEKMLKNGQRPSIVYTVPIANNPTGTSMSEERKMKLVKLSTEYGFKIVADEVYQFLHFGETVPTSLYEYDSVDNPTVFSVNSFSKILAPGLRVGWIATNKKYISRLLECPSLQSGGGFNPMASAVVSQLMESDFLYKHTDFLRKNYKKTCDVLCSALEEHVVPALKDGEKLIYEKPTGGFFCFVSLPERFDTEKLLDISVKKGVTYFCGKFFSPDEKSFKNCLRLCFAFLEAEEITKGVERLAEAVRSY